MNETRPKPSVVGDRSLGLVVFGVVEIAIGGCCLVLAPLTIAAAVIGGPLGGPGSNFWSAMSVSALSVITAGVFVWLGVGSMRARRWACELLLALSWIWLLTGLCSLAFGVAVLPVLMREMAAGFGLPPDVILIVNLVVLGVAGFFYAVLPGAMVIFYRSPHVGATCRVRDPGPQWIDRCPRRLLTLTIVWLLSALSILLMPAYNFFFPAFGLVLTGARGAVAWSVIFGVAVTLAVGTFRGARWAWRAGVVLSVVGCFASTVTLLRLDMAELATLMGLPDEQAAMMTAIGVSGGWLAALVNAVVWASFVAYLVTLRRFFSPSPREADG